MLRFTIPQPCHENWESMTPVEKGRFCASCSKTVTDFSRMSDAEVLARVNSHSGNCGRFRSDQLNRPMLFISPEVLVMDIPLWKKYLAILFICFSGVITGCNEAERDITSYPVPEVPIARPIAKVDTLLQPEDVVVPIILPGDRELWIFRSSEATTEDCEIWVAGNFITEKILPPFEEPPTTLMQKLFGKH